ncbi:MAG: hypothetical protein KDA81_12910 [Planctomycetaceae bacterium]|nr:hypothetical protein [Planctomycetaceae bacterium]
MQRRRRNLFRLTAFLMGLLCCLAAELLCRTFDSSSTSKLTDGYSDFVSVRPLFVESADRAELRIAANRRAFFADDAFPATKSRDEFRIFVFGGSTVQGRPFSIQTSFPTFLKRALTVTAPERKWTVVNCGGISYASYRLLPLLAECRNYSPDLYIVCCGHNEFLECVTYADVRSSGDVTSTAFDLLHHSAAARLARNAFLNFRQRNRSDHAQHGRELQLPEEVDAMLDHHGGLQAYCREALHIDTVVREFGSNLNQMVTLCREGSIPLILMVPPSNLRDTAPFKSEFGSQTTSDQRQQIQALLLEADAARKSEPDRAVRLLNECVRLDADFAYSWYQLGQVLLQNHDDHGAEAAFVRARDCDVCPLRMVSALEEKMRSVAASTSGPLIDLPEEFSTISRHGIPGDDLLVDHIHPSFRMHQQISLWLLQRFAGSLLPVTLSSRSPELIQADFDRHMQSLDSMYFLRGRRTIQVLKAWTQGRAEEPLLVSDPESKEMPAVPDIRKPAEAKP